MATVSTFNQQSTRQSQTTVVDAGNRTRSVVYISHWAVVTGRILYSAIFIVASFGHFSANTIFMAQSQGVPFANILVPLSGLMALAGGLSILFGYREKIGALLLMAFLLPVTLTMHNFWAVSNPMMQQMQEAMFLKNVSLFGAAILIYQFAVDPVRASRRTITRKPTSFSPSVVGG